MREISRLRQVVLLSMLLFGFWIVLSGKLDTFHLSLGAISAIAIARGTNRLLLLPPAIGPAGQHPVLTMPWLHLPQYVAWLMWQIVLASLQVAYVVLHPSMPIHPRVIRFRTRLPHALARVTLANSITLTPGTVTLDVEDDEFIVHALTDQLAQDLDPLVGNGEMQRRVTGLFVRDQIPPAQE